MRITQNTHLGGIVLGKLPAEIPPQITSFVTWNLWKYCLWSAFSSKNFTFVKWMLWCSFAVLDVLQLSYLNNKASYEDFFIWNKNSNLIKIFVQTTQNLLIRRSALYTFWQLHCFLTHQPFLRSQFHCKIESSFWCSSPSFGWKTLHDRHIVQISYSIREIIFGV